MTQVAPVLNAGTAVPPDGRTRDVRSARRHPRRRNGSVLFVGPAMACLAAFGVVPILIAVVVSLTDMDIRGLANPGTVKFIGFQNYRQLFGDSAFWQSLRNTIFFVCVGVPVIVVGSLAVAIGLNMSIGRYFRFLRAFYFLPAITAIVAISLIWGYLYNSQFGMLNYALSLVGVDPVNWLTDPGIARFSVAAVAVWRASGLNIIILLAAMQAIPVEYYEAAALDGAGEWRKIRSITIPLLRFAVFFVTVTTVINWMQFFDEPYVLTNGGPVNATTSLSLYIYKEGFKFNEFGYAAAASIVLLVLIGTVTAVQLRLTRTRNG